MEVPITPGCGLEADAITPGCIYEGVACNEFGTFPGYGLEAGEVILGEDGTAHGTDVDDGAPYSEGGTTLGYGLPGTILPGNTDEVLDIVPCIDGADCTPCRVTDGITLG